MKVVRKKKALRSRSSVDGRPSRSRATVSSSQRRLASGRLRASRTAVVHSKSRKLLNKKMVNDRPQLSQAAHVQLANAVKEFESGVLMFQKQNFERAKEIFEKLMAKGPVEVASRAGSYLKMCEQKLVVGAMPSRSARDFYDIGVAQLNARKLDAALESFSRADKMSPRQEHIRYVLAATYALQGNADAALEHLAAAIELRPANRSLAAQDEDFQPLASDSRYQKLIRPGGM